MVKPFYIQTIVLSFLLLSCASAPANAQSGEPEFAIAVKNKDDKVSIQHKNGTAVVDIQSPSGIGSATFQLESSVMPEKMIVRLHLQGLEEVRLSVAGESISASVSSGEEPSISQKIVSAGTEAPILPGNPSWMEIEIVSKGKEKKIPLEEGYFEITIPKEFLQEAETSFTIEWIDFYR